MVHMKITLRRSDWWYWEGDNPLAINPYKPFPGGNRNNDSKIMLQMWEEEKQKPSWKREFDPDYWGSAFHSASPKFGDSDDGVRNGKVLCGPGGGYR